MADNDKHTPMSSLDAAFARGKYDAEKDRAPIFRSTRAHGIIATVDDDAAADWDTDSRQAYLAGYDFGRESAMFNTKEG